MRFTQTSMPWGQLKVVYRPDGSFDCTCLCKFCHESSSPDLPAGSNPLFDAKPGHKPDCPLHENNIEGTLAKRQHAAEFNPHNPAPPPMIGLHYRDWRVWAGAGVGLAAAVGLGAWLL